MSRSILCAFCIITRSRRSARTNYGAITGAKQCCCHHHYGVKCDEARTTSNKRRRRTARACALQRRIPAIERACIRHITSARWPGYLLRVLKHVLCGFFSLTVAERVLRCVRSVCPGRPRFIFGVDFSLSAPLEPSQFVQ